MRRRKAFMTSIEEICFAPNNETIVLLDADKDCTFMEKIDRRRFELDCSEDDGWFVLDGYIKVNKGENEEEAPRAEYYRHHLGSFVRNLFRFHNIPYEEKLANDALHFLGACL